MSEIWKIVAELGIELHPDRILVAAKKIASLKSAKDFPSAKSSFGPNVNTALVSSLEEAWVKSDGIPPTELASALLTASLTSSLAESRGTTEMVWTGPSTGMIPVRHTEQVLCEVIRAARWRLFLVSFVAYNIDSILKELRNAVGRNVELNILLELSSAHGGRISVDSAKLVRDSLPSANIYIWDQSSTTKKDGVGAVHAKCAVADGSVAFVTSANLTTAAMERNIELGVLVRGGTLPDRLHRHLEALVTTGVIKPI